MSEAFRFVTRANCHLCEQARPVVMDLVQRYGGRVVEVDVDSDDQLVKEFSLRIPVLLDEAGAVLAEGEIDKSYLRQALRRWRRGRR